MPSANSINHTAHLLKQQTENIDSILASISEVIVVTSMQGTILRFDAAAENLFGYTSEEISGHSIKILMTNPDSSLLDHYIEEYQTSQKSNAVEKGREVTGIHKNGQHISIWLTIRIISQGIIYFVIRITCDIEKNKHLLAEQVENQNRLQLILGASQMGICEINLNNGFITFDQNCYSMYQISPESFMVNLEDLALLIHIDDRPKLMLELMRAIDNNQECHTEFRIVCHDGQIIYTKTHGKWISDNTFILAHLDVSEYKTIEHDLQLAHDKQEIAIRTKEAFLATMSHEIRTPLSGLLGMLELLSMSVLSPYQSQTLQMARDSGAHLLRILDDVLDLSKMGNNKLVLSIVPSSIQKIT